MLTEQTIQETARRIAAAATAPARVVLFGSYSRGDADESSDLDLLVIEPEIADPTAEYLRLRQAIGPIGVGVDLLLYTQSDFEQRRNWWTTPIYWADREGKVLHEPAH
jgi:predicted nucleotidyltransferase